MHQISELIELFNGLFAESEQTVLQAGADEPVYLPRDKNHSFHRIVFAHGFFSSALHEVAHWCIAGRERRQQLDYGYWYEPDGRTAEKQHLFARVEARPQALEWILAKACDHRFVVSLDNLSGEAVDTSPFKQAIMHEIHQFRKSGLPPRAEILHRALAEFYRQPTMLDAYHFDILELA